MGIIAYFILKTSEFPAETGGDYVKQQQKKKVFWKRQKTSDCIENDESAKWKQKRFFNLYINLCFLAISVQAVRS